ncbi:MAG: myo-inositol-1(or 4)-monophosphatase [Arenicella sp.]|jgi:myo-inositol-1(or 4)-monophosphatase
MQSFLEVAKRAARLGGDIINHGAKNLSSLKIEQKTLHDYVSEIDRNSEKAVSNAILDAFPDHQIVGEEYGKIGADADVQWVVDPLDGTTNFLRGIPHYAVSIGVLVNKQLVHAVVYDPAKNEMFCASKGEGASLNGATIRVSSLTSPRGGLFATGVPFSGDNLANVDKFTNTMVDLLNQHTSGIRRLGSAALDLAYVAAGRYDGYWEPNLKIWDIAGGALLVTEAGGEISDFQGRDGYLSSGDIIAAPKGVHQSMVEIASRNYVA